MTPFEADARARPRLGLVVLSVDETIEQDFQRLFAARSAVLHVSRVASGTALTPQSINAMERDLTAAAAMLPPAVIFDGLGYACTSGTAHIGAARVAELLRAGRRARSVSEPLSAAIAALRHLECHRIGLVSPYTADVSQPLTQTLARAGIETARALSFGEAEEARVARITPASLAAAARAAAPDMQAVFLSCTNLRSLDIIAPLEAELGIPVISSNQVLAWHMARRAGLTCDVRIGRLMTQPAA